MERTQRLHLLSIAVLSQHTERTGPFLPPVESGLPQTNFPSESPANHVKPNRVSESVLIIVRFGINRPTFAVVKDENKQLLGFPFGRKDAQDKTSTDAAKRECKEEIFWGLEVTPELTEENLIGTIAVATDHTVTVFAIDIPENTPIAKGKEQEAAFRVPETTIETYITQGLFRQTHTTAWSMYKKKRDEK